MISAWKQSKAVKKGVVMFATRSQDVPMQEIVEKMRGWAAPLKDKVLHNQQADVEAINVPDFVRYYKDPGFDPKQHFTYKEGRPIAQPPCS